MNALSAYADLRRFGKPVLQTEEVALRLHLGLSGATKLLQRLVKAGLVLALRRGLYSLNTKLDPLALPESLTAPSPAYVSLFSALYLHGLVSQIPQVIYVATLGKPARIETSLGTYSLHRLSPEFFGGYETRGDPETGQIHLATAEKALLDVLYLGNTRSRLFAHLPELELPAGFRAAEARRWIARIAAPAVRTRVRRAFAEVLRREREDDTEAG